MWIIPYQRKLKGKKERKAYFCGLIVAWSVLCNGENGERAGEREVSFEECREKERIGNFLPLGNLGAQKRVKGFVV